VHCWHHANDERAINKNLGITFTFWDFIFNTAILPKDEAFPKKGLGFLNDSEYQPFMNQIFKPIMKLIQLKVEKQRAL
jgi:sterol desaturase/sphingolipid hydroxylase (fatty acid hydroxylase superfamily)